LSSYLHGLDRDRLYVLVVENTIQPSAASFAVVFGAAYVSPTMKLGVAFVFGAAMTLISGFGLMSMLSTNNWWGVLNLIFSIAGSMIGIKVIFDEIKKQQAIEIPS
jgi:amino acid transporter